MKQFQPKDPALMYCITASHHPGLFLIPTYIKQSSLFFKRITLSPSIGYGYPPYGGLLEIGNVIPQGTVVGFYFPEETSEVSGIIAVVYDDSKEGQDDALTTISCKLSR